METSILDNLRSVINSHPLNDIVTRKEFLAVLGDKSQRYLDKTRRGLTVCGYLEDTGTPGKYRVIKHVENDMNVSKLEKMRDESYEKYANTYINNSASQTEHFRKTYD